MEDSRDHFEDIKANYESVVAEKDKEIVSQRKAIEEYDERLCVLISKESNNGVPCNLLKKQSNEIENFRLKPKRKGSAKNVLVKCEKPSCESTNMDMIRCNLCLQFVCEQCSEIPVAKLKTIMDKCKTLYFICKSCNENFPEGSDTNNETEKQKIQGKKADGRDLVETFEDTLNQIMRETKNEELVQQQEREVRSKNIIIHGCSEAPVIQESKVEDNYIVNELFRIIGVEAIPASTIRIGKRSDTRPRPIKIVMSNQNEKEMVMNNLGKLKNAVEKFERISVTDDYTAEERDEIKNQVTEARNKTDAEGEGVYIWKVRGSPKNRLRLIRFTKSGPQVEIPNQ